MTDTEPWTVRHIYSAADKRFSPYLRCMRHLLDQAHGAGWIEEPHPDVPVFHDDQILPALAAVKFGELVIVDLHGWADVDDDARLGTMTEGPYARLADLPAGACDAAAIVLTNCRGARKEFATALARIVRRDTALAGHFDEASFRDHAPIHIVRAILRDAAGADPAEALRAMDIEIHNGRAIPWGYDLIRPA